MCGCSRMLHLGEAEGGLERYPQTLPGGEAQQPYVPPVAEEVPEAEQEEAQDDYASLLAVREGLGITDAAIEACMAKQNGRYCYDKLYESEKRLYAELLLCLEMQLEEVVISTEDSDELQYVFQCLFNDHPEIYWIDGYTYSRHSRGDEILFLSFAGKYTYTLEERSQLQEKIDAYVREFQAGVGNKNEYEKVKYVFEYIIENTDYSVAARDNQNILSVFLYGESVCQGYAKATQYLLETLGIPCTIVVGTVYTGEGHAWNLVQIDGDYYYLDSTWGDSSYQLLGSDLGDHVPINYDYLNITTEELLRTHELHNIVELPECTSMRANYYQVENLLFTTYDDRHMYDVFTRAYEEGWESITLKASSAEVFGVLQQELLNNQRIFEYLKGQTDSIVYSISEQNRSLSFWL